VLVFALLLDYFPQRRAVLAPVYLCLLPQVAGQIPALARQEVGLLFFGVLVLALFGRSLQGTQRYVVAFGSLAGLVISHYSTSYIAVIVLVVTWAIWAVVRVIQRLRKVSFGRPRVPGLLVAFGIGAVLLWDGTITHSTSNVTQFLGTVQAQGLAILPNANGGAVSRFINGNTAKQITPTQYYAKAAAYAKLHQPWLDPYPAKLTKPYHAQAATISKFRDLVPGSGGPLHIAQTLATELLLALMVIGVGVALLRRRRRELPGELLLTAAAFVVFLVVIRLSGSVAGSYNATRAEVQGVVLTGLGLSVVLGWAARRRWHPVVTGAFALGLAVSFAQTAGLLIPVTGGGPFLAFANSGQQYVQFYISPQDVAAAAWIGDNAAHGQIVYMDSYGEYRLRAGTDAPLQIQDLLTPATIFRGSMVFATTPNIAHHVAIGDLDGIEIYGFPSAFLGAQTNIVYASPTTRVYE
jgi:uncharacterized membrane protein